MDGNSSGSGFSPGDGFKEVRRRVIDLDAPGMKAEIDAAVARINASEDEAFILAEMELNAAEVWAMIPE